MAFKSHSRKPSLKRKFGREEPDAIELPETRAGPGPSTAKQAKVEDDGEESDFVRKNDDAKDGIRRPSEEWGESSARNDTGYDEGEEFEMLLDPQNPEEGVRHRRTSGDTGSFDDDDAFKATDELEDSPYEEVRAAVHNYDEDVPCSTLRAWIIGLTFVVIGASVNTLFSLRAPSIGIGPLVAQLLSWVMGRLWERTVPAKQFRLFGMVLDLNPGPFNVKEHSIIVVMASVSFTVAYATDIILAQKVFYNQDFGMLFQILLVISTQSLGYGIAGMMRKFLVYPASMIWPANLASVVLLNSMYEKHQPKDPTVIGGSMPRFAWFGLITLGSFVYYFLPGFFAQFLSVFAFPTWLAPQNVVVNQLFGGNTGLALLPITFDWAQISGYNGSPMVSPWSAIASITVGVVVFFIFGSSLMHYTGAWYSQFLPMNDAATYDNTGSSYDITRVLTPELTLDEEAYKNYSPLFISTTFAFAYGTSFAAIASLVVYTWIHHRKTIWAQYRNSTNEKPDIHMKLMRKYPEAPGWWYLSLFLIVLAMGMFAILAWPTNMSWWAFLLSVAISFIFALPIGIIQAVTNNQIGLNVLTEFVYGYLQPGRPLALMLFKCYGYITLSQALRFVEDLKFGHYMKIPPRTMFMCQVVATTISCFIQVAVLNFALTHIDGVCEPTQPDHWTCPGGRVFFSASVIWGLIGPGRIFSPGQVYSGLFWFFPLGALLPVALYYASKKWPRSPVRHLVAPLIFGAGNIPPATPLNYLSWGFVGYIFNYRIKKRAFGWWSRLNYLTSSGLDLGLALSTLFIFFALTLNGISPPKWWGNDVVKTTMDYHGTAVQVKVAEAESFGPKSW